MDNNLNLVLKKASNDDLGILMEMMKDKLSELLTVSEKYKLYYPDHSQYYDIIANEIRLFGGNTLANIARGLEGPPYHEVVCDVAKKIDANFNKNQDIKSIEKAIFDKLLSEMLDKMSEDDKISLLKELGVSEKGAIRGMSTTIIQTMFRAGGFASYQLLLVIVNGLLKSIIGRGLSLAANAALVRIASIVAGPLGIALSLLWTIVDIAGPSYKVTIPCVAYVGWLRYQQSLVQCTNKDCGGLFEAGAFKFCPQCGSKIID